MVQSQVQHKTVTDVMVQEITQRVDAVFGLMGNGNVDFISTLTAQGFPFISVRHEAAAVVAADAYFRATGKMAVATTTYGAGFTNTITGLAEAQLAATPMVVIVGAAPSSGPRPFDIDQAMVTAGLNVVNLTVDANTVAATVRQALDMAEHGEQPVVVFVPYDLSATPVHEAQDDAGYSYVAEPQPVASNQQLEDIAQALVQAKRPLILSGGGVVRTGMGQQVRQLGDAVGAVFMHSLRAANVTGSPHSLGLAGGFMAPEVLPAVHAADMVLMLGATANNFQVRKGSLFATENIHRIDLGEQWNVSLPHINTVFGDLADAVPRLLQLVEAKTPQPGTFRSEVGQLIGPNPVADEPEFGADGRLNPRLVANRLNTVLPENRQVVYDGGHFMSWSVERIDVPDPGAMMAVGTAFQSIGFGLGSAVGAAVARPNRFTACITGDGGAQMALAELGTFVDQTRHGAVIVLNDAAYGAEIHQYAVTGADPTAMMLPDVDFAALGAAFGATGLTVNTLADLDAFEQWIQQGHGVAVVNVNISTQFAHPALQPGATG